MDDLVSWLEAQIAEDEQDAQNMEHLNVDDGGFHSCPAVHTEPFGDLPWGEDACHCGMPARRARLLAECEAKRLLIELASGMLNEAEDFDDKAQRTDALTILRGLGVLYAKLGRPGYQESWRPA